MNRLDLFPLSTKIQNGKLTIARCDLDALVTEHGTPLYLYDRATLDSAASLYRRTLAERYPGPASITYAGKAYLCKALCQWTQTHGLAIDCTGAGEIAIAVAANVPREKILVHGVNKSDEDLRAAIQHAGTIVVDNPSELARLVKYHAQTPDRFPDLWLRFQPGQAVQTHHAFTQTGHADSKFGMAWNEMIQAIQFCREQHLPFNGIHFHQGSQFHDPAPLRSAIEHALDLAQEANIGGAWHLSPGGGWGAAYHEDELPHPDVETYVRFVADHVLAGCQSRKLDLPHLRLEPGRSLVARAGVAVYRIGTIKHTSNKTWILVDGGMTDNIRYALYGARYSALPVNGIDRPFDAIVDIAGPVCESGDVLIEGLPFPTVAEGELIAVPVAGAYHLSMASNYNGARRPAVLWLEEGQAKTIVERETIADLLKRDKGL
jgi:diaminopimelate decarboxylase